MLLFFLPNTCCSWVDSYCWHNFFYRNFTGAYIVYIHSTKIAGQITTYVRTACLLCRPRIVFALSWHNTPHVRTVVQPTAAGIIPLQENRRYVRMYIHTHKVPLRRYVENVELDNKKIQKEARRESNVFKTSSRSTSALAAEKYTHHARRTESYYPREPK